MNVSGGPGAVGGVCVVGAVGEVGGSSTVGVVGVAAAVGELGVVGAGVGVGDAIGAGAGAVVGFVFFMEGGGCNATSKKSSGPSSTSSVMDSKTRPARCRCSNVMGRSVCFTQW